ncbi:MAG: hypothetical protein ABWK53_01350 [Anaerolineales bacterium]
MLRPKSPFFWFLFAVLLAAGLTAIGPQEQTLGENVRVIYLHGAWVLAAEMTLAAAGVTGLLGILFRRPDLHRWSAGLGRSGIFFWVASLPLALWAMQTTWNGLFLAEPRFRLIVTFAVSGILIQIGLALIARPTFTSLGNLLFAVALQIGLSQTDYVMHPPPSPIFGSAATAIQLYFIGLLFLLLAAAYYLTRWWLSR